MDQPDLVKDYLTKIGTSSQHLLSLINDVLDMSRIESGVVKIEEKEVCIPDIIHDLKRLSKEISRPNSRIFILTHKMLSMRMLSLIDYV